LSIVVDASVLVRALVVDSGPDGQWAEAIIERGATLHAPELVYVEVTDVLRKLERAKDITTADAIAAHEDLLELNLELFSFEPFAERVWELRHNLTSHDAWYVAVAETLGLPLATLDKRLAKTSGLTCDFLTPRQR
jgi:predicted nucleic acid-binding protein